MKPLELMNYEYVRYKTDIDLDRLDEIETITISVISGDEIATITYKNGQTISIDADDLAERRRIHDHFEGTYILYSEGCVNMLEEFEKRETADWWE